MEAHESLLYKNEQRYYIGTVTKVSRKELSEINDSVGNLLYPMEILFDVGDLLSNCRAVPLEINSEVNVGDRVIILSMESIYNNTFYYHPIRTISENNDTIYMKYGNSIIEFSPVNESKTDIVISDGKSIIVMSPHDERVNIKSGYGGIKLDSGEGLIDIRNDDKSLHEIMLKFIDTLVSAKVTVPGGVGILSTLTANSLIGIKSDLTELLGDVKDTDYYPYVPKDTYTVEFVTKVLSLTGVGILNDEGDGEASEDIKLLLKNLPMDKIIVPGTPELAGEITNKSTLLSTDCNLDLSLIPSTKISDNFTIGDVSTKATFPHLLQAQHNLTKMQIACNLRIVAINILEPMLIKYPNMIINSGYRGKPSLKNRISQHEIGQAVDLQFPGMTPKDYLEAAKWVTENISFDQFIFEHGNSIWFHISCKSEGNRNRLLTMYKGKYESGTKLYYT